MGRLMSGDIEHLEIEVKFHLPDPLSMADRLMALGAVAQPKVFERNLCFDDDCNRLVQAGRLLRLRKDNQCRLTFKSRPRQQTSDFKIVKELEVTVSDFDTMCDMLHALGYCQVRVYEKWRQTFEWEDVLLCLDTLPFGHFLEIEGPCEAIRNAATQLTLVWNERIIKNYLAIFEVLRDGLSLPFTDVTFDHFEGSRIDIAPFLPVLYAAKPCEMPHVR